MFYIYKEKNLILMEFLGTSQIIFFYIFFIIHFNKINIYLIFYNLI